VYHFLRQSSPTNSPNCFSPSELAAIKTLANSDPDFRNLLHEELSQFGANRRKHPYFDKDLEVFEVKGRLGPIMLRRFGQLRVGVVGVVEDGMPVRRRSRSERFSARGMSPDRATVRRRSAITL
jgi:hypothetical protein